MIRSVVWDGKPVASPGIYEGVPLEVYHSQDVCVGTSVSSSGLRRILERNGGSPAHFYAEWSGNPDHVEPEETAALKMGRLVHHLMMGQPNFHKYFIRQPTMVRNPQTGETVPWHGSRKRWTVCDDRGKALIYDVGTTRAPLTAEEWTEYAQKTGRTIVTQKQIDDVVGISKALAHTKWAGKMLTGLIERSLFYRDEPTGLWVKVRPDAVPTDGTDAADLKTTTSVQYHDVVRTISNFAYHQQMALVRTAFRRVLNLEITTCSLVFVEKKPPYCSRPFVLKTEDLDRGERQNRIALDLLARCIKDARWPGPGDDHISYVDLAQWYRDAVDEDLTQQGVAA